MSRRYGGQSGALPEVNEAHPLAQGLRFAAVPVGDRLVDVFGRLFATPEGLSLVTPTPDGPAVKFSGAERISYSLAPRFNAGNGTRFAWVFRFRGTTDTAQALFHYGDGTANNRSAIYVGNAVTGGLTDELITLTRIESGTANNVGYTTATRTELFDGRVHTIVVISSGTSFALYLDGVPKTLTIASGSSNHGRMDVSGATTASIGAQNTGSWGAHLTGEVLFAGWWVLRNTTTFDWALRLSGPELWELFEAPGSGLWKAAPVSGAITGELTQTLGSITSAATGTVLIAGTASPTLDALTSSATGTLALTGAAAPTLDDLTSAATGTLAISGTASPALDDLALSSTGVIGDVPISGELTATLDALTAAATGTVDIAAELGITLGDLVVSSAGTLPLTGAAGITLEALTSTAAGAVALTGALGASLAALTLAAAGTSASTRSGELTATLDDLSLDAELSSFWKSGSPVGHGPQLRSRAQQQLARRRANLSTRNR